MQTYLLWAILFVIFALFALEVAKNSAEMKDPILDAKLICYMYFIH